MHCEVEALVLKGLLLLQIQLAKWYKNKFLASANPLPSRIPLILQLLSSSEMLRKPCSMIITYVTNDQDTLPRTLLARTSAEAFPTSLQHLMYSWICHDEEAQSGPKTQRSLGGMKLWHSIGFRHS